MLPRKTIHFKRGKIMSFLKTANIYKVVRTTGLQDNILEISFIDENTNDNDI